MGLRVLGCRVDLLGKFISTFLESFFYRSPRLVRAWPASQARASFSPVKACFCVNTAGQLLLFLL